MGSKRKPNGHIPRKGHGLSKDEYIGLKKAIDSYLPKALEERLDTGEGAGGLCNEISDDFLHELSAFGVEGLIEYYGFDDDNDATPERQKQDIDDYPLDVDGCMWHWAVRVGNLVIDWTAKQFDETANLPAIWISEKRPWRNCGDNDEEVLDHQERA
jgi:hypothetical protein